MGTNQRAQIVMTSAEVRQFLQRSRTATVASFGPDGMPTATCLVLTPACLTNWAITWANFCWSALESLIANLDSSGT